MIEGIVFDKDGTLFDFQATWSAPFLALLDRVAPGALYADAAEALGYDPARGVFRSDSLVIASTTYEVAACLEGIVGRSAVEIVAIMNEIGGAARQVPVPNLKPVLERLGAERPLGLVTNDSEAPARAHLAEAGVSTFFDFVAGYDSGFGAKPGPGQLLAFAETVGLMPARVAMVGDSLHDLVAAQAAGMVPVGVLTGVAGAEELAPFAEVVLPDIGGLEAWIIERSVV
ncbi:MAG: HAD family hydrolase [Paracoccaceae bacterium]|nr:HAD family hydrolase [Paracoccaceae bacterium]